MEEEAFEVTWLTAVSIAILVFLGSASANAMPTDVPAKSSTVSQLDIQASDCPQRSASCIGLV